MALEPLPPVKNLSDQQIAKRSTPASGTQENIAQRLFLEKKIRGGENASVS